jgi:hypothetical protein
VLVDVMASEPFGLLAGDDAHCRAAARPTHPPVVPLKVAWSPTRRLPELVPGPLVELDGPPEVAGPVPVVDVVVSAPEFDGALVVVVVADEPPVAVPARGAVTEWEPGVADVVRATAGAGPDRAITARPAATAGSMTVTMPTERRRNTGRRLGRPALGT